MIVKSAVNQISPGQLIPIEWQGEHTKEDRQARKDPKQHGPKAAWVHKFLAHSLEMFDDYCYPRGPNQPLFPAPKNPVRVRIGAPNPCTGCRRRCLEKQVRSEHSVATAEAEH